MDNPLMLLLNIWIKFFFVITPFFALSMFLSMTEDYSEVRRRQLAISVTAATAAICLILLFVGNHLFALFGITLDSFRIGAGALLFLSAISLVQGRTAAPDKMDDIAVVPLAMPIVVGPATTGTLLVMGAELNGFTAKALGSLALLLAIAGLGLVLLGGSFIQRTLGNKGITILTKITGLILAALASQMIMTGIQAFIRAANMPM